MEGATILALVALGVSGFSLLIAIGTAIRLQRQPPGFAGPMPAGRGLAAGTAVPTAALDRLSSDGMLALITFVGSGCGACDELVAQFNRRGLLPNGLHVFMVHSGPGDDGLQRTATFPAKWIADPERELQNAFETHGTPHTFLVSAGHVVDQRLGTDVRELISRAKRLVQA